MTIRLVISDVDGTLVRKDKSLAPATIAAVARLRGAGVRFTLISARPPSGIVPLIGALDLRDPAGAYNGGTVISADGSILSAHRLSEVAVQASFAVAAGSEAQPWLFADGRWHVRTTDNPHVPHERIAAGQEPVVVEDMTPLFARTDKLTWVSDDPSLLRDLEAQMKARIESDATIALSQTYYLDLTHPLANKGDGIAALAAAIGVDLAEVAVLGDMANDLPMFACAGLSIAMGQAPDNVRAAADHVSTSNEDDGVAHAIDTILLPMIEGERR